MAVAIHMSKNEDTESASNTVDNDSVNSVPGWFVTYEVMGYGIITDKPEKEK
jgi:hypothetical protein